MTGAELRRRRQALCLTQQALADRLGVAKMTVWRWEHEQMAIEHPRLLALALEALAHRQAQSVSLP